MKNTGIPSRRFMRWFMRGDVEPVWNREFMAFRYGVVFETAHGEAAHGMTNCARAKNAQCADEESHGTQG